MQLSAFALIAIPLPFALAAPLDLANSLATLTSPAPAMKRQGLGTAIVHNNCAFDISLDRVTDVDGGAMVIPAGQGWAEPYQTRADGGGISIKLSGGDGPGGVVQFEYTIDDDMGMLFYDLSFVDGDPFRPYSQVLVPSDPTCVTAACAPGESPCAAAYNVWNDDQATHGCGLASNLDLFLCAGP